MKKKKKNNRSQQDHVISLELVSSAVLFQTVLSDRIAAQLQICNVIHYAFFFFKADFESNLYQGWVVLCLTLKPILQYLLHLITFFISKLAVLLYKASR